MLAIAFLMLAVIGQPAVFPERQARPGGAVIVGQVGVVTIGSQAGFDMRIAKELKKHCPAVNVVSEKEGADYVVLFAGTRKEITVFKDKEVLHASSSSWSVKKVVKNACQAITDDWQKSKEKKE